MSQPTFLGRRTISQMTPWHGREWHKGKKLTPSLDIQFRLLRADSISGMQQGLMAVKADMQADNYPKTEREF
jgi:hypothetical protein